MVVTHLESCNHGPKICVQVILATLLEAVSGLSDLTMAIITRRASKRPQRTPGPASNVKYNREKDKAYDEELQRAEKKRARMQRRTKITPHKKPRTVSQKQSRGGSGDASAHPSPASDDNGFDFMIGIDDDATDAEHSRHEANSRETSAPPSPSGDNDFGHNMDSEDALGARVNLVKQQDDSQVVEAGSRQHHGDAADNMRVAKQERPNPTKKDPASIVIQEVDNQDPDPSDEDVFLRFPFPVTEADIPMLVIPPVLKGALADPPFSGSGYVYEVLESDRTGLIATVLRNNWSALFENAYLNDSILDFHAKW